MVPARGWQVVRYKPLNELLRKTQRREVGGLHRGDIWAQDSVLYGAGRPSLVLRMSSEVRFTRERGGKGGRHEQAVPYSAAAAAGGGGRFFFLVPRGPAASSGSAGRWPPLTAHPRSCIQSPAPGSPEPLIPPQVAPHQAWPRAAPRA